LTISNFEKTWATVAHAGQVLPTRSELSHPETGEGGEMKIEVLFVPNCPNHPVALERLSEILSAEDFRKFVSEVLVKDAEMAQLLRFPGSPTIRINGQDVEPKGEPFGIMCRLYSDGSGVPSTQRLRAAINQAREASFEKAFNPFENKNDAT